MDERLGRLLSRLNQSWQQRTYAAMAAAGHADIRPAHSPVFRLLGADGARVVDLAAAAGMTKQSMTYLVRDLEALGYVETRPDPADRRARIIRFTDSGRAANHALARISRALEQDLAGDIGTERLDALKDALGDVLERET